MHCPPPGLRAQSTTLHAAHPWLQSSSVYRKEVDELHLWCKDNNMIINKTKEISVDFRPPPSHPYIDGAKVEVVSWTKYLKIHLSPPSDGM